MNIYFDNAATTVLDNEVFQVMLPFFTQYYGNPSSIHRHGRVTRDAIEGVRRKIASILNASPNEILFTSGGTEADNTAILTAVEGLGIKHAITSRLEHHAVLTTLQVLEKKGVISLSYISNDEYGNLDLNHLDELLSVNQRSFVSIMHGNNEIGNINPIDQIGEICKKYNAIFHTDTVQTISHFPFDLSKVNIHFLTASAHKFHGPKGVGFLFVRNSITPLALIQGGSQERHFRAGTENVAGIAGLGKALEIAHNKLPIHNESIKSLKRYCVDLLKLYNPDIQFNGNSADPDKSLPNILSASFPAGQVDLLATLDFSGIAVSGGSACNSGSGSHVLSALNADPQRHTIRFSFSKYNTIAEVNVMIEKLCSITRLKAVA